MQSHRQRFALQLRFPSISKSVLAKLQFLLKQLLVCYIIKRFILKIIYCYINFHSLDVRTISQFRPRIWHRDSQNQVKEIQFFILRRRVANLRILVSIGYSYSQTVIPLQLRAQADSGRDQSVHRKRSQNFELKMALAGPTLYI